jgi:hypothetical protein
MAQHKPPPANLSVPIGRPQAVTSTSQVKLEPGTQRQPPAVTPAVLPERTQAETSGAQTEAEPIAQQPAPAAVAAVPPERTPTISAPQTKSEPVTRQRPPAAKTASTAHPAFDTSPRPTKPKRSAICRAARLRMLRQRHGLNCEYARRLPRLKTSAKRAHRSGRSAGRKPRELNMMCKRAHHSGHSGTIMTGGSSRDNSGGRIRVAGVGLPPQDALIRRVGLRTRGARPLKDRQGCRLSCVVFEPPTEWPRTIVKSQ